MKNIYITLSNEEWLKEVESILQTKFHKDEYSISQLAPVSIKTEMDIPGNILIIDSNTYNLNKPFEMINNFEVQARILYLDLDNNFKYTHEKVTVFNLLNDLYQFILTGKKEKNDAQSNLNYQAEQYNKEHEDLQGNEEEIEIEIGSSFNKKTDDEILKRANNIRKHSFHPSPYNSNKTIGIWSPLHRMGVTQFIVNFSIFLAQFRIPVAALETPNNVQHLKHLLLQYTDIPKNWSSYATALSNESISPNSVKWLYQNVHWIPLDYNDSNINWQEDLLFHYINNLKFFDVVLVDLPTSEMEDYTLEIAKQLDELWILVDDSYVQLKGWKEYIHNLQEQLNISIKLVFNKKDTYSKTKLIEDELQIPILTEIPSVYYELQKNNYETNPIILNHTVYKKLYGAYLELAKHILGENIEPKNNSRVLRYIIDRIIK